METRVTLLLRKRNTQTLQISFPEHLDVLTKDGLTLASHESAQVFLVESLVGLSHHLSVTG